jgi:hypothetical protein
VEANQELLAHVIGCPLFSKALHQLKGGTPVKVRRQGSGHDLRGLVKIL